MALPSSGTISLNQVNAELKKSATAAISMNDSAVRALAGVASGAISMSNLLGKSSVIVPTISVSSVSGTTTGKSGANYYVNYKLGGTAPTTSGRWVSGGSGITASRVSNTQYRFTTEISFNARKRTGTWRVTATNSAGSSYVDRALVLYDGHGN